MNRVAVSRIQYGDGSGKTVEFSRLRNVSFVTVGNEADPQDVDVLYVQWSWCQRIYIARRDALHICLVLASEEGGVPYLDMLAPIGEDEKLRDLVRMHSGNVFRISKPEYEGVVKQGPARGGGLRVGSRSPPSGWPLGELVHDVDVDMDKPTTPTRKRAQDDLSSGLPESRRSKPKPKPVQLSDLWLPTTDGADLDSLWNPSGSMGEVTNSTIDAWSGVLQKQLDNEGTGVWITPLAFTSPADSIDRRYIMGVQYRGDLYGIDGLAKVVGSRDMWLMPVFEGGRNNAVGHYYLLVWAGWARPWMIFDSNNPDRIRMEKYSKVIRTVIQRLRDLGFEEYEEALWPTSWEVRQTPQQWDGTSCGIYVMRNVERLAWMSPSDFTSMKGAIGWGPELPMQVVRRAMRGVLAGTLAGTLRP